MSPVDSPIRRLAKLSPPRTSGLIPRPRLFDRLDRAARRGSGWIYGPPGSGRTSLLATWIETRTQVPLWYRADADDCDAATLVPYLRELASEQAPAAPPLPALTPGYLEALGTFARCFMRDLYARLPASFILVIDDVHQIAADSPAQVILTAAVSEVPTGSAVVLRGGTAPPSALARFALQEGTVAWRDLQFDPSEARALLAGIDPTQGP